MDYVRVTDVSPRDGLQNEKGVIPTQDKVRLIELLCETGVDEVEVTSFVSPKWVPQLGDAKEVCAALKKQMKVLFSALVPNAQGLTSFLESNTPTPLLSKVSVFAAASETFSKKNTNGSIDEVLTRFVPVIEQAHKHDLAVRAYISCVIACPFEGPISPTQVVRVAEKLLDMGVDEIDLGDTIGAAVPKSLADLLNEYNSLDEVEDPDVPITLHFHDTFGHAADCVKTALDLGIRSFDASVAGLGGCPYASTPTKRAPGNISTELLVRTIHDAGYKTNVNLDKLETAATFARDIVAKSRATT